jgi:hypothetical protein
MADFVDDDTLAAIRSLWLKDGNPVAALVTEPIQTGLLKSGQSSLYAVAACQKMKDRDWQTGGKFRDYRKVTITFYGPKTDVTKAMQLAGDLYNRNCQLTYPSGARFNWWFPLDSRLEEDDEQRQGNDVWRGVIEAEVASARGSG